MASTDSPIPIVDFGKFLYGNNEEKENVAREIDSAFRDVGFVYLKNHGIAREEVDACFEWVRDHSHFSCVLSFPNVFSVEPSAMHLMLTGISRGNSSLYQWKRRCSLRTHQEARIIVDILRLELRKSVSIHMALRRLQS